MLTLINNVISNTTTANTQTELWKLKLGSRETCLLRYSYGKIKESFTEFFFFFTFYEWLWVITRFNWSTIFSFMCNVFQIVVWPFVVFLLVMVLSVILLFMASDYPLFIFILFLRFQWEISRTRGEGSHIGCQIKIPKLSHMSQRFMFDWSIYMTCGYLYI